MTNDPSTDLCALLEASPSAVLAALGPDARPIAVPESVARTGRQLHTCRSTMDAVIPEDRPLIIDAWIRVQTDPVVGVEVRLVADPSRHALVHFFDVRDQHGAFLIVLPTSDPERILETVSADDRIKPIAHVERDATSTFIEIDDNTTTLLGWTREQLLGRQTVELVHPDDIERAVEAWLAMRMEPDEARVQLRLRHANGHYVWLEVTNRNHLDDPDIGCIRSTFVDISEEMEALEALHQRERLLHRLAETLPVGICHLRPDGQVLHTNPPLVALLGPVEGVDSLVKRVVEDDRDLLQMAIDRALEGRSIDLEVGVEHDEGERRCELTFRTMVNDDGGTDGVVVCATDVTDRSRLRSELEHRASHDQLSGCLNRAATVAALERALRDRRTVTVAYIDLDRFKEVNDDLGHAAGDEVLRVAAARLRGVIRSDDVVGRVGGDEFVIICPQGVEPIDLPPFVARIRNAVCGDVSFARHRIGLRASVGAAVSLPGENDAELLLSRADAAMYLDKAASSVSR